MALDPKACSVSITAEIFEAFLNCPTKAFLISTCAVQASADFTEWQKSRRREFKEQNSQRFLSTFQTDECCVGTPPVEAVVQGRYRAIVNLVAAPSGISSCVDALERIPPKEPGDLGYIPIRFVHYEKLSASDKLLLAFDALAVSYTFGSAPRFGRIIHGPRSATVRVPLKGLVEKAKSILGHIQTQQIKGTPPALILNKHCPSCEFQTGCRQLAMDRDELTLLSSMSEKEREKYHARGIFTVTQLSHTFRARKDSSKALPHQHALKALAIRKNQIHILGAPMLSAAGRPVYFDVEGDPDRSFYYLVGLRTESHGSFLQHAFWANKQCDEQEMWTNCLRALRSIEKPRLIHYGSYETQFLKTMQSRYPNVEDPIFVEALIASTLNLLTLIYKHVYFPTYSNGLKEVAHHLGFCWTDQSGSGLKATMWRQQWEASREEWLKDQLILYNTEDCQALQMVAHTLTRILEGTGLNKTSAPDVVDVASLKHEFPRRFGPVDFVLPEFQQINEASYWDYQRNKVYLRSNRRVNRRDPAFVHRMARAIRINKTIQVEEERPAYCPRCKAELIYRTGRFAQIVCDLQFSSTSMKRWVVRYLYNRYICWRCKASFFKYVRKHKYGPNLCAYLVYQVIELRIPQSGAAKALTQLFSLPIPRGAIQHIKAREAGRCQGAYELILERIVAGKLVHADETKIEVDRKDRYVWVFTNLEDVAFFYSETREASTVQKALANFNGVLVSDFYAGYDSIQCAQQKCLVHFIRDLNEDLCKQPFNEEMKQLSQEFACLVKPMVESVDRFGLKARYLRRHKVVVDRFYRWLSSRDYLTEMAIGYRKRFERNRNKLFTFLDFDGVPWNNNNAEHAIKAFARLRNTIGGKSSPKGMQEYLVLLSVSETCKYRNLSFLDFLRSGEMDVEAFGKKGA